MPRDGERSFGGLNPRKFPGRGNSVAIGIHSAGGVWSKTAERCLPVLFYVIGLIISRTMIHGERQRRLEKASVSPLVIEKLLLFLFARAADRNLAVRLGALAMGVQAAAITRFNRIPVHTAFVTGSLVKYADRLVAGVREQDEIERRLAFEQSIWFPGIWIVYVGGAAGGAGAFQSNGVSVVYWTFPVLALAGFHVFRRQED